MQTRSSSTQLPPVRRTRRRDWVRVFCRILCVLLAACGLVPIGVGLLVRTSFARGIATRETRAIAAKYGINAAYEIELRVWPLSVAVENLRIESSDGGSPFLTARRVTAKPKIFGLLAGKLVIDQVEIDRPTARVVMKGGKLITAGRIVVSGDGKSRTVTMSGTDAKGQRVSKNEVYEKQ